MPATDPNIASQWKAFTPEQRDAALARMTSEQKTKLAAALGYKEQSAAPAASPSVWERMKANFNANTSGPKPGDTGVKAQLEKFGQGGGDVIRSLAHPVNTAKSMFNQNFGAPEDTGALGVAEALGGPGVRQAISLAKGLYHEPARTLGQVGTGAILGEAGGEALGGVAKVLPKAASKAIETVTKTSPKETAELVKETKAANEAEATKATAKNAEQEAKRKVDLSKHFEKAQAIKEENAAKEGQVDRKEALNRGVEHLDKNFRDNLTKLRDQVHEQANAKYTALNEALDEQEAEPAFLPDALLHAADKIKGSETQPAILKDMEKKVSHGDPVSYRDLQGYYSELGKELTKGTLPGDVYAAFDTLQNAVGEEMQNIANNNGLGDQLRDARNTWRQMKQTFYDPKSPITKAIKSDSNLRYKAGDSVKALQGRDDAVQALAKYSPELAKQANTIRGYQSEAATLPKKATGLKSVPKLSEKPAPVTVEPKTIGAEDISNAKAKGLQSRANWIRNRGAWAATWPVFYALKDILHGNFGGVPGAATESMATFAAVQGIAKLFENPKVVEFLTKATPEDIKQVPPDLRGDLPEIVAEAKKRGMPISPALGAVEHPQRKRVAAVLQPK